MVVENPCPKCNCENTYHDGTLWVCPECFHEWDPAELAQQEQLAAKAKQVLDCNGNELKTGDAITVIKDLKVKGTAAGLKSGTKIKPIRIVESVDGHNIACKVDGMGSLFLKSEFVRKA